MEFKYRLKKLRIKKHVSQQELANSIYVSRSAIAKWENGLGLPNETSYKALLTFFNVSREEFPLNEETENISIAKNRKIRNLWTANLRKNKLLFINTILLLVSFIVFFIFLHIINYDSHDDGRYSPMTILRERLLYHNDAEYFIQNCFVTYIPTILLTLSLAYFIMLFVLLGKKEVQIKYLFLLICQSIYLIAIGYNYMLDLTWYKGDHYNEYLSSEMLLPLIVFSVYYLACIVSFYLKDKKKPVDIEKAVDTEKENII